MSERKKPTIKLTFDGLIMFHFKNDMKKEVSYCDAVILRAKEHDFNIEIKGLDDEERLRGSIQNAKLTFKVAGQEGVRSHHSPFDRAVGEGWEHDFRWVVNLAGADFHKEPLGPVAGSHALTRPRQESAHGINDLQFMEIQCGDFYTESKQKVVKCHPHSKECCENSQGCPNGKEEVVWVADSVGCKVTLTEGQVAELIIEPLGDKGGNRRDIWFPYKQDASYEIKVSNNRRPGTKPHAEHEHTGAGHLPATPQQIGKLEPADPPRVHPSDFHHYYEMFEIAERDQFVIKPYRPDGAIPSGSDELPCNPCTCGCPPPPPPWP